MFPKLRMCERIVAAHGFRGCVKIQNQDRSVKKNAEIILDSPPKKRRAGL